MPGLFNQILMKCKVDQIVAGKIRELDEAVIHLKIAKHELEEAKREVARRGREIAEVKQEHAGSLGEMKETIIHIIKNDQRKFLDGTRKKELAIDINIDESKVKEYHHLVNSISSFMKKKDGTNRKFEYSREKLLESIEAAKKRNAKLNTEIEFIRSLKGELKQSPISHPPPQANCTAPEYTLAIPVLEEKRQDNVTIRTYESGHIEYLYPTGVNMQQYPNGYLLITYPNSDIKQVFPDGRTVYVYSESNIVQTSAPDGSQTVRYPNGQVEKHSSDRTVTVKFLDGTTTTTRNSTTRTVFPDSSVLSVSHGKKLLRHPGGHSFSSALDGKLKLVK